MYAGNKKYIRACKISKIIELIVNRVALSETTESIYRPIHFKLSYIENVENISSAEAFQLAYGWSVVLPLCLFVTLITLEWDTLCLPLP